MSGFDQADQDRCGLAEAETNILDWFGWVPGVLCELVEIDPAQSLFRWVQRGLC